MESIKKPETLLERYGRAILQMEQWEWSDIIGPKPDGFDDLPIEQRVEIIKPHLKEAREIVGPVVESYWRHKVDFNGSDERWLKRRRDACKREREREESYRSFLRERIEMADSKLDNAYSLFELLLFGGLCILLGFTICFNLV